jgi:hypothetical protein
MSYSEACNRSSEEPVTPTHGRSQAKALSPQEVEAQQEALLSEKYGGLKPKHRLLAQKAGRQCFDSADWAMEQQGLQPQILLPESPAVKFENSPHSSPSVSTLPIKAAPSPTPSRRVSHLGE